jgi:Sensors of blue-light using FAD
MNPCMVARRAGNQNTMLMQLIYYSQPFGFDDSMLNGILLQARRNNARHGLTGALIVRGDLYLQLLEGPAPAVEATFAKIRGDNRHLAVKPLAREITPDRMFPDWTMRDDPAQSWLWTEDQIAAGALDTASLVALRAVFERIER